MLGCISRDVKEATVTFGPGEAVGSSPRSLQSLPISSQGCPGVPVTLLSELLPLDDERRADNEVWLAFTARALIDPQFRVRHAEIDDALRAASLRAVEMLGLPAGRERRLEAERLHALLDGLALHGAMRPEPLPPRRLVAVLRHHLDELGGKA